MRLSGSPYRLAFVLLVTSFGAGFLLLKFAATLIVDRNDPAAFQTIQDAIDEASVGDDVFVRCGTYVENVFMRDGVSLRGQSPYCTVIDGNLDGDTVVMPIITLPTTLEGFSIRNAEHRPEPGVTGSGILINGGAPVITGNIVEDNGQLSLGHGIYFRGFSASDAPVITRNLIRDNASCCSGGGLLMLSAEAATISTNIFAGNTAYYGAGLFVYGDDVAITNNTIADNDAAVAGGVWANTTNGVLANNVVAFNSAYIDYGGVVWFDGVLQSNDVFGNTPTNWDPISDPGGANGNKTIDPWFVDMNDRSFEGFQPRSFSRLIDAGSVTYSEAIDLRGIPRNVDGNADGLGAPDIGARENEGLTQLIFDGVTFLWDWGLHEPMDFNLYRGDLAMLRQSGIYTQDPDAVPGARHFCDTVNVVGDLDDPEPGQAFFYLPVAWGAVEGSLGFHSDLTERPKTLFCIGP